MLRRPAICAISITSVLGMLFVLALVQKVCPWLWEPGKPQPERHSSRAALPRKTDAPTNGEQKKQTPPLSLASALPDVLAMRGQAAAAQVAVSILTERIPRLVACGVKPPQGGSQVGPGPADWHLLWLPREAVGVAMVAGSEWNRIGAGDPAIHTSISPTGPPRA